MRKFALDLIVRPFSSVELACAVRRACVLCAHLLRCCCPRTCPTCDRCNATSSEHFLHTSHFALHSSHPALHAPHWHFTLHSSSHLKSSDFFSPRVTSSDLLSSHPIPSHMSSKQVLLNCFHIIRAPKKKFISTHPSSSAGQKAPTNRDIFLQQKRCAHKAFCPQKELETQLHLHRKILTT